MRKEGFWTAEPYKKPVNGHYIGYVCSQCGKKVGMKMSICPECGAIMLRRCEKVRGRKGNAVKSVFRYGCDLCQKSIVVKENEGGVEILNYSTFEEDSPKDSPRRLFCPLQECPYREEIEEHSTANYDEYDEWKRTNFKVNIF